MLKTVFIFKLIKTVVSGGRIFQIKMQKKRLAAKLCPDLLGELNFPADPQPQWELICSQGGGFDWGRD